jgi:hypothetical protein
VNGDEIYINSWNDSLPEYTFDVYELTLNYHHFINNFIGLKALLNKEQSLNVNTQLVVTVGLTFALIGLHFILILRFLNKIINSDKFEREVFDSHVVKYLNKQNEITKLIKKESYLSPIKKTLFFSFVVSFAYTVAKYLLHKSFTNIVLQTIFVNLKVFNSIYNNVILTPHFDFPGRDSLRTLAI